MPWMSSHDRVGRDDADLWISLGPVTETGSAFPLLHAWLLAEVKT